VTSTAPSPFESRSSLTSVGDSAVMRSEPLRPVTSRAPVRANASSAYCTIASTVATVTSPAAACEAIRPAVVVVERPGVKLPGGGVASVSMTVCCV
jgi:hypothetical protein